MPGPSEEKNQSGELKKSELLLAREKAKEIIEVLVAMYRSMYSPEAAANDAASDDAK